jgi:FG-GAP-like repeat
LNGDGIPDLVFTDSDPSNDTPIVEVALGVGDGTFAKPVSHPVAGGGLAIADVNGDGIPDIVTSGVTILFGDGKGGFGDRRDVLAEASGDPIVTDFDGDASRISRSVLAVRR